MSNLLSIDGPWRLLAQLRRLVAERTPADAEIPAEFAANETAVKEKYQADWEKVLAGYEERKRAVEADYATTRGTIVAEFGANYRATHKEYDDLRRETIAQGKAASEAQKKKRQDAHWEATTIFEATKDGPDIELRGIEEQLSGAAAEIEAIGQDAVGVLKRRWQWREHDDPEVLDTPASEEPFHRLFELLALARDQWRELHYQRVPGLFEGGRPFGLFLLVWLVVVYPFGAWLGWGTWYWAVGSGAAALAVWGALGTWFYFIAKRQATDGYLTLRRTLIEADRVRLQALEAARKESEQKRAAIVRRLHDELKQADEEYASDSDERRRRKESVLGELDSKYPDILREIAANRDRELQEAKAAYAENLKGVDSQFAQQSARLLDDYTAEIKRCRKQFESAWSEMADRWLVGTAGLQADAGAMNRQCGERFPAWDSPAWSNWTPPQSVPPAIPFGRFEADLHEIEGGIPEDERLMPPETAFSLPSLLSFSEGSLLLLKASGAGRAAAVEAIQTVMLRMLTSIPPGKVRFTIIDPVGLGENFSAFMHLADYDEQLVSNRIWTESGHIERRLTDMTEHMENVIQAYLRNEFRSIREYNDFAGEMAEPYRVLVIANFPANFTESAARRLASIVSSGARCGVYTILSVDAKLQLPRDFHLADLEAHALDLTWENGGFVWNHPEFGRQPVAVDRPPSAERFTDLVRTVAVRLKEADRVEVPFQCIVPDEAAWWTSDSSGGIDVPLGRAGAMKLQHLQLGKGTAQHVLIAGRTGSGKSTLLHALITSLSLHYSPDEVELYLIDFKKGVEFKAFASHGLPHAKVIAIESEREFGLSVLERLDQELRRRGDLFRSLGVQDLKSFRAARPDAAMPRVLLIVDEFQELFVEDDRIAQSASLLLDRLVRQGRAFGVHVLLGSQTLAGAYSLPRSTIGQMAVRIALQCSEADAHLILSEENTAARLLTRPGEAIYNDANGLYEGNHPFQVVWLPDVQREAYLRQIGRLAARKNYVSEPAIVFEGNAPADPSKNALLQETIAAASWTGTNRSAQAWLGASVAIKSPTAAVFARQSGSNLLVVGHREEEALGILATGMVSLAAQQSPCNPDNGCPGASFYVFDGTRPDAPEVGFWEEMVPVVPHRVKVVRPRDAEAAMAEIADELARRQETGDENAPPVYLIVYNLARFRDLRKAEDDFSFSRPSEEKPNPAARFAGVLREGPPLGIHALVWCDTYNTVNRWLDRQALRDLELRALFQMNAADSSSLIDSPAASRLGVHRAVLYDEEQGRLEKFRPYGVPPKDWLASVRSQLHSRPR
jgi:energy-coupling factor transporter ATP-binding protein EcfA2